MPKASKRVLVAEDSPAISKVISFNLQRAGFLVSAALDGQQARDFLDGEDFDLVILDEQMPVMSGSELCNYMRSQQRHRLTPTVFLTAKSLELDTDALKNEYGVEAVLSKPFSPSQLIELSESIVAQQAEANQ